MEPVPILRLRINASASGAAVPFPTCKTGGALHIEQTNAD